MSNETLHEPTVAEVVANDYRTAEIFKKHGIDFCCGGKKTIEKVCTEKGVDYNTLVAEIEAICKAPKENTKSFNDWSLTFLVDYIEQVHHQYVNNNLSLITEFAEKVARVHGVHNPETADIAKLWDSVVADLTMHMSKEEQVLFPYIRNLEKYSKGETMKFPSSPFGTVKNPIQMMEHEHDLAGNLMKHIEALSNGFNPPAHACNTYRVLYAKLKEFQDDLHAHVHLENNILFPKAEVMEETFRPANDSCAI